MKRLIYVLAVTAMLLGCSSLRGAGTATGQPPEVPFRSSEPVFTAGPSEAATRSQTPTSASSQHRDAVSESNAPSSSCPPIQVPDLSENGTNTPGGYPPPVEVLAGGGVTTADAIRSEGFDLELVTAPRPLQALIARYRDNKIAGVDQYYANQLDDTTMVNDFIADGGILVTQADTQGQDADQVMKNVNGTAVIVDLGPYDAAVLRADPLAPGGARPYDVYWSDGTFDWGVVAGTRTAEEAVAVAASLYCH